MENNNRTIIAIALIILLWSGYSLFFSPQPAPPVDNTQSAAVEQQTKTPKPASVLRVSRVQESLVAPEYIPADYQERLITVSTALFDIKLSTTGAVVRAVTLNKHKESNAEDSEPFKLLELSTDTISTFKTSGSEGLYIPTDLPYKLIEGSDNIRVDTGSKVVRFSATTATGLTVVKSYTFNADTYQVNVSVELINNGDQVNKGLFNLSLLFPWFDDDSGEGMQDMYSFVGALSFDGNELLEDDPEDLQKSAKIYGEGIVWSGFSAKYFLTILSPLNAAKQIQVQMGDGYIENRFISPFVSLEPGQNVTFEYASFIGPKDYDLLKASGHQFEQAKDYGFFSILAKPLMHVLKFFYGFIGNYGFAVILLTVCIKLIFWPLTQKSYKSMKGMQKLQPQMQKMREKYKNDKQRLNQEMMSFYKENKVNPLGGCLPMLIQIPVFFALYQVLLGAIELRHAPFIFWITDLSVKDPYYITPLIMGATMFIQQKMTPTNMDPTQAKIMLMMPVVFTFMFLNFPAGLVVYWMVNNLLTILQQYLIKRQPD
jgi:YidC/Oxa1 family membrane protein insertase